MQTWIKQESSIYINSISGDVVFKTGRGMAYLTEHPEELGKDIVEGAQQFFLEEEGEVISIAGYNMVKDDGQSASFVADSFLFEDLPKHIAEHPPEVVSLDGFGILVRPPKEVEAAVEAILSNSSDEINRMLTMTYGHYLMSEEMDIPSMSAVFITSESSFSSQMGASDTFQASIESGEVNAPSVVDLVEASAKSMSKEEILDRIEMLKQDPNVPAVIKAMLNDKNLSNDILERFGKKEEEEPEVKEAPKSHWQTSAAEDVEITDDKLMDLSSALAEGGDINDFIERM